MSALATASNTSRNPFRSNPTTPNVTGTGTGYSSPPSFPSGPADVTPSPSFPSSSNAPQISVTPATSNAREPENPQQRIFDAEDLEEPPPYTASPGTFGEVTVEQGPARPFQPAPPRPTTQPNWPPAQSRINMASPLASNNTGDRAESLFQFLRTSLNEAIHGREYSSQSGMDNYRSGMSSQPTGQSGWSSYPGQPQHRPAQSQPQYAPPSHPPPGHLAPPRHPASSLSSSNVTGDRSPRSSMRRRSSEFARDFYAAGTADNLINTNEGSYAPPPGPPPTPIQRSASTRNPSSSAPDDGRPTTNPTPGHPLLKDGKLLVYPKGHECDRCHNVGYKRADPSRPCKKCWHKYAKPFTGPLVYSFNNPASPNSTSPDSNSNFQRPLPVPARAPPPVPPRPSPLPARFAEGGYMPDRSGAFHLPPTGFQPPGMSRPPPGSIVYMAGDPRIGGRQCWRCEGRGNVSFLFFDQLTCEVCGGIGRTFN